MDPAGVQDMTANTREAFSAMRRILRGVETQSRDLLVKTGLTPSQLVLLQQLENGEERRVSDLAAALGISAATTTVMTQKLEALGLLRRRQGSTDRRQSWLSLNATGEAALNAAPDSTQARFASRFERLEVWEQLMLVAALTRVADLLNADTDAAPILDSRAVLSDPPS